MSEPAQTIDSPWSDRSPTPVYLLTGFLGSGKTTLLKHLIRQQGMADTAVIVNELGEVGLDHDLIAQGEEDDVVLLDSGCLCCALTGSLGETLTDLFHRRSRMDFPNFSRVIIETTGLADPGPIIKNILADRIIASRYRVAAIIATVDAVLAPRYLDRYVEFAKQIAVADRIVITKIDEVEVDSIQKLRRYLIDLNSIAEILEIANGQVAPEQLLSIVPQTINSPPIHIEDQDTGKNEADHDHVHDHGVHTNNIQTLFLSISEPISWRYYAFLVSILQKFFGEKLLRAKGLLMFEGESTPRIIQGVQHLFASPVELGRESKEPLGLVLIGENIDMLQIQTELDRNK